MQIWDTQRIILSMLYLNTPYIACKWTCRDERDIYILPKEGNIFKKWNCIIDVLITLNFIMIYLFVCLWVFVPFESFSLIWRRHNCRWRAANFYLCSALMAIEQWGFFSVPHVMWHGASVYYGHLRGHVTLTPVAERLAVELSLPVFTT